MVFVSLLNELCDLSPGCVPEGEDVVDESSPDERPVKPLWFKIFVSTLAKKILVKATAIAVPCVLGSFFH